MSAWSFEMLSSLGAAEEFIRRFVVLDDDQMTAVVLWTAHTHAFDAAECTPYLSITSAEMESGKTRLLEVLQLLVANPWFTGRTTAAALTRKIDASAPTLLLDESDAAFNGNPEYSEALRGTLNSGYAEGGAVTVCARVGGKFEVQDLSCFCPKAIAGLEKLPDTVQSRSIPIRLKKRKPSELVEKFRLRHVGYEAHDLAEELEHVFGEAVADLPVTEVDLPDELSDRAQDVWEPLFQIAELAGEDWPGRAVRAALVLSGQREAEEATVGVQLLTDMRAAFDGDQQMPTAELVRRLCRMEESPWGGWNKAEGIKPRQIAKMLRRFEIRSRHLRTDRGTRMGYRKADCEDAWERHLPCTPGSKYDIHDIGSVEPKTAPVPNTT